ncbi:MAG: lysophospholipid acyltransferase family protein [Opitutaceae bacterium]
MIYIVKALSHILSWMPICFLKLICNVFGCIIYHALPARRTVALRNLHHCFPQKTEAQRVSIFKEHCRRLVEMALSVIILPTISEKRAKSMFEAPDEATLKKAEDIQRNGAAITLTPHFTLSELVNAAPIHFPTLKNKASVIFRPLNDPKLNEWVTNSRSRFGVELLSRRNGYNQALRRLEEGNVVGILFDQNAAGKGSMIHFFNRIASSSELPGLLAHKKNVPCHVIYPERIGFLRGRICIEEISTGDHPIHVTIAANDWLESYLGSSDDHCADWLWLHDRWGSPQNPKRRFHLKSKRNRLELEASYREGKPLKPMLALWLYLPTDEADFRDLPKVLQAINQARPDYSIKLIGSHKPEIIEKHFGDLPDNYIVCQDQLSQIEIVEQISKEYPDIWINLETTRSSLKLSHASQAHQRFGLENVRNAKKYLTHLGPPPNESWLPFFEKFGLKP